MMENMLFLCIERIDGLTNGCRNLEKTVGLTSGCRNLVRMLTVYRNNIGTLGEVISTGQIGVCGCSAGKED